MTVKQTVAGLKALAEATRDEEVRDAIQAAFWDEAMRHWLVAHWEEFDALMEEVAPNFAKKDGAVALLAVYVTTARVERSVRTSTARLEIMQALRRLANDIADEMWNRPS